MEHPILLGVESRGRVRIAFMPWSSRLPQPLKPRERAPLTTLADVRAFMLALPGGEASRPVWQHAAKLAMEAAESGKPSDIRTAADQVKRALFVTHQLDLSDASAKRGTQSARGKS